MSLPSPAGKTPPPGGSERKRLPGAGNRQFRRFLALGSTFSQDLLTFLKDLRRLPLRQVLISAPMLMAMHKPAEELSAAEARRAALSYVTEAFALALLDGIDGDAFAEAALCTAMCA